MVCVNSDGGPPIDEVSGKIRAWFKRFSVGGILFGFNSLVFVTYRLGFPEKLQMTRGTPRLVHWAPEPDTYRSS